MRRRIVLSESREFPSRAVSVSDRLDILRTVALGASRISK